MKSVSVIIPTLNAGSSFPELLSILHNQTVSPADIVIVDSESNDETASTANAHGCKIVTIERKDFAHGLARNLGARAASGEILLFLTQDVTPRNPDFIAVLTSPITQGTCAAAYGRQIARDTARATERFLRLYNYPDRSSVRSWADTRTLGIRAFMLSNAASAISTEIFWSLGGFQDRILTNEDMLFCTRLLRTGASVAYVASAQVLHSHDYDLLTTFRRYFDVGSFSAEYRKELGSVASSSDGRQYVTSLFRYLLAEKQYGELAFATGEVFAKFAGYKLGLLQQSLPRSLVRSMSRHPAYWGER